MPDLDERFFRAIQRMISNKGSMLLTTAKFVISKSNQA
jgi:hypothetical protein